MSALNYIFYFTEHCINFLGIKLRKVEKQNNDAKEERNSKALHDVASILARRVAIELSDSESESDDDSEGWIEPNETSA